MYIREVQSSQDVQNFLRLPVKLYQNSPCWIRPLNEDIEAVFDPHSNKTFQHGRCKRWILLSDKGEPLGRIAAFVDDTTVLKGNEQPTGGIGFFECTDDRAVAFKLFDTARSWLSKLGMEAMDGPINFGSRDRWWGLLQEGFQLPPNYQCNYHLPYYQNLFESYGFQVYFYQYTFGRPIDGPVDSKVVRKAQLVHNRGNYHFDFVRQKDWGTLPEKIVQVYNKAWAWRGEMPELTLQEATHLVEQMKPVLDERLLWFGYYRSEPIAFFLSLPDVNEIVRHLNGSLDLWGKLKFMWYKMSVRPRKAIGILFGVVPEHQGRGVDGALIEAFRSYARTPQFPYQQMEMNWIGDFNPRMLRVAEQIGATPVKRHATYRKLFDEGKPFKRLPALS